VITTRRYTNPHLLYFTLLYPAPLWRFSAILAPDINVLTYLLTYLLKPTDRWNRLSQENIHVSHLVTYLVWPHQGDIGLGGSVHEEAILVSLIFLNHPLKALTLEASTAR